MLSYSRAMNIECKRAEVKRIDDRYVGKFPLYPSAKKASQYYFYGDV